MIDEQETQETGAMPLEESQESAVTVPDQETEVEAVEPQEPPAVETEPEAVPAEQPSKLEKAFQRVKEENRSLKSQIRDLQNQISKLQTAELNRNVGDIARKYSLSREQSEILKRAESPEERESLARSMKPPMHTPMFGTLPRETNVPKTKVIDSIPTLARH